MNEFNKFVLSMFSGKIYKKKNYKFFVEINFFVFKKLYKRNSIIFLCLLCEFIDLQ